VTEVGAVAVLLDTDVVWVDVELDCCVISISVGTLFVDSAVIVKTFEVAVTYSAVVISVNDSK
jgi:hypothetical protein